MSLLDDMKQKAAGLAGDTQRVGKVTAAQVKLKSLQGNVESARRDLGAQTYALIKSGELSHPELEHAVAAVDAAQAAVDAKAAEIEALKKSGAGAAPAGDAQAAADATPPEGQ